jgi:aspartate oxidase
MNPLAIELYRRYKVDIAAEPLEFAVNHQHMNGGIAVDVWGRSSLPGCYAIGEAAGTHGVTRPGGAALNAGQVFGTRAAEHIASLPKAKVQTDTYSAIQAIDRIKSLLQPDSPLTPQTLRDAVQARMSDHAGILCTPEAVTQALTEARQLNADIAAKGIALGRTNDAARAIQRHHMALASEAVLTALDHYIRHGGGSRGARAICDPAGASLPETSGGPLEAYRFRKEKPDHKDEQLVVRMTDGTMQVSVRPNRSFDQTAKSFFERDWPDWLTGAIYRQDSKC